MTDPARTPEAIRDYTPRDIKLCRDTLVTTAAGVRGGRGRREIRP